MNLKESLLSKQLPIQHRFYNLITILYAAAGIIGFVVCFSFNVNKGITWGTLVFSILCLIFCGLGKVGENYKVWAILFYIFVNLILMPIAYLKMGGHQVGADAWIICSLVLGVLSLPKKAVYILSAPICVIYGGLYYLIYKQPDLMWQVQNKNAALFIVAVSVSAASVGLSLMLLYQRIGYEEQLKLNQVKESELKRLVEELEKAKEQANRINVAKTGFLKSMSDGMNAPLSILLEKGELLKLSEDGQNKEIGREVSASVKTVSSMVDNLVTLSMIESGELTLGDEKYSLRDQLQKIYDVVKVQTEKKDLKLVFDIDKGLPDALRGDEKRIRQIIINLLMNGIQYTSVGEIHLKIQKEERGDRNIRMRISVSDTGIGIKQEDIDTLFYRFHADEQELSNGYDLIGLGLTVSNQILQLMGTKLEVTSDYGQGSTFSFSLVQRVEGRKAMDAKSAVQEEEKKDSYEELLAMDVRRMMEDLKGDRQNG